MVQRNWWGFHSLGLWIALGICAFVAAGCGADWFKVGSVKVTPVNPSVVAGSTQQFTAMVAFQGGTPFDGTGTSTWASSDSTVATINATGNSAGLATALKAGSTTISATNGGVTSSTTLTVTAARSLVSIAVTPVNPSVAISNSVQLKATGTFNDGSTADLTSTANWSSSDTTEAPPT
jgi:hypothetical protein